MHQVDHRHGSVGFSERRRHGRKCPWPQAGAAEIGWQHQAKQSILAQCLDCLGGKPPFLVILSRGGGKDARGDILSFRLRRLEIHGFPPLLRADQTMLGKLSLRYNTPTRPAPSAQRRSQFGENQGSESLKPPAPTEDSTAGGIRTAPGRRRRRGRSSAWPCHRRPGPGGWKRPAPRSCTRRSRRRRSRPARRD